ncbi:hypothetical protein D3C75_1249410 [compost metagenome]
MLTDGRRAAEGHLPATLHEAFENLHHVPAGGRGARFGPDIADDQDVEGGCEHVRKAPWQKRLLEQIGATLGAGIAVLTPPECFVPCRATDRC